jgi:hypothetical protein
MVEGVVLTGWPSNVLRFVAEESFQEIPEVNVLDEDLLDRRGTSFKIVGVSAKPGRCAYPAGPFFTYKTLNGSSW